MKNIKVKNPKSILIFWSGSTTPEQKRALRAMKKAGLAETSENTNSIILLVNNAVELNYKEVTETPKPKGGLKVYCTSIFLNSEGRITLFGAFKSWKAFAETLGVSRTKASVEGRVLEKGKLSEWALAHPETSWQSVGDNWAGGKFTGVIPVTSKFRHRNRMHNKNNGAKEYVEANKGTLVEDM